MSVFKKHVVLLVAVSLVALFGYACEDPISGGNGVVCKEDVSVSNAGPATLYYPCNLSTAVPATTVMSGYTGDKEDIAWLAQAIAENGFVALAITPTSQYTGMVNMWRNAHKGGIARLKALASGKFAGKIDASKLGTCGHSKGGGGSLWASADLAGEISSTIGMAPYNGYNGPFTPEGPSPFQIAKVKAPTFIQAGSADTLATNPMTEAEYNNLTASDRCYHEYAGYDHMVWATGSASQKSILAADVVSWLKHAFYGESIPSGLCPGIPGGGTPTGPCN